MEQLNKNVICNRCNKSKNREHEMKKKGKDLNGNQLYAKFCKECYNLDQRKTMECEEKITNNTKQKEITYMFNEDEVALLKCLCTKLSKEGIEKVGNKANRGKALFNIDKNIKSRLIEFCKDSYLSQSDVVNLALYDFLNKKEA